MVKLLRAELQEWWHIIAAFALIALCAWLLI